MSEGDASNWSAALRDALAVAVAQIAQGCVAEGNPNEVEKILIYQCTNSLIAQVAQQGGNAAGDAETDAERPDLAERLAIQAEPLLPTPGTVARIKLDDDQRRAVAGLLRAAVVPHGLRPAAVRLD